MSDFFQDPPVLGNQYEQDRTLRRYLARRLPPDVLIEVEEDLRRFGGRCVGDIARLAEDAHAHEPTLRQFDPWGNRIDEIETSRGWQALDRISAEEGIVGIGYERQVRPAVARLPVRQAVLVQPVIGHLHLSLGDERRRRALARSDGGRGTARRRTATTHHARSRRVLDLGTVDDGTGRRFGCRTDGDRGPA